MDNPSYNIRVPKRWARIAAIVGVLALIVAPLTAVATHSFDDVSNDNTFHADIEWLKAADVTKGCNPPDNNLFCPEDNVTREQMSAFMRRLAENQVVDADKVDGLDASAFLGSDVAPALTGDTIQFSGGGTVNGLTTIEEVQVSAPADGFLLVSANSVFDSATETNILVWAQIDDTTCDNSTDVVTSIGFGYALTTGTMDFTSASFDGPVAVSEGDHTLTLCANPFNGNLSPTLRGAAIQGLFTADGSITANAAGSIGPLGGVSD